VSLQAHAPFSLSAVMKAVHTNQESVFAPDPVITYGVDISTHPYRNSNPGTFQPTAYP
jgi:hypothetical protein